MHLPLVRLLAALGTVVLTAGCGSGSASGSGSADDDAAAAATSAPGSATAEPAETTATPTPTQLELPGGGTEVFPGHRLVGFSGAPGSPALGPMTGDLAAATGRLQEQASPYADGRALLPVVELIATVVQSVPGPNGDWTVTADDATVQQYLDAARAAGGILLLGIQPGSGDFLPAVQHYERWLTEPDVGVALDPEWAIEPGEVPGNVFGSTTGAELDGVSAYLDGLVTAGHLPQKVMLYHQLHADIVSGQEALVDRPGIALVKSVDGIGAPADKVGTYQRVMAGTPPFVHAGFKLFYDEDTRSGPLMTPPEVLALVPQPEYVLYE